ncbi:MAG: nodulation protein NfeD [Nitrososphaerota archaeon]|nr:nodulation protein NfeD [Nitrososphaerota archaeon]
MNRLLFAVIIITLVLIPISTVRSQTPAKVVVVNFDYTVDPGASAMMRQAVGTAINDHSVAILIVMNSPGGYLSDMLDIINSITLANQSGIAVYTYVPQNGIAASAASYISMATNRILMAPGTEIGPSTPIVVGGTALEENHTEDAMLKLMVGLANEWGRNSTAAYNMVLYDTAYSANQALQYNVINGEASNITVAEASLGIGGLPSVTVGESYYDQFLSALSNSTLDGVLILIGMIAIILDLLHPTVLLSIGGVIAIVLGLIGAEVINASVLGIVILVLAAVFLIVELKTGHGVAFLAAVATGAAGIYFLNQGIGYSPAPSGWDLIVSIIIILIAGVFISFYIRRAFKFIRTNKVFTGSESMIGVNGLATTDIDPNGEVSIDGVRWRAFSSSGKIGKGRRVKVVAVNGIVLRVEPYPGEQEAHTGQ